MKTPHPFTWIVTVTALLLSACSSHYVPVLKDQGVDLAWPPKGPRVRYAGSITGFQEEGASARSTLRIIAFGRENKGGFSNPVDIAIGPGGRMAVADTGARCVHLYVPGQRLYMRITGAGRGREFQSPVGVIFDREAMLYVSDSGRGQVYLYDRDGRFMKTVESGFKRPTGLSFDPVRRLLYVVDTLDHRVYAVDRIGQVLFAFGERGSEEGQFNFPTHIFRGPDSRIYVTDAMNFRIQFFSARGDFLGLFGHHGDGSGDFAMPKGVAVDKNGVIFVVDALFDNVQLFDEWGKLLLTIGGRGTGPGEFWLPSGAFIDNESNTLYVCDTYNKRVQVFKLLE